MTDVLTPNAKQQFFTNNGLPAASYRIFTYAAGTTTKLATHTDSSGAVNNANPIVLDYRGEANIWIQPNKAYKYTFAPPGSDDPPTAPIWTVDNVVSSQLITLYAGSDTGSANVYVVNFTANFTSLTDGIILYFLPANTSTGASTLNVNGLGAVPIVDSDGTALANGRIVANIIIGVIYRGGKFYLLYPSVVSGTFTGSLTGMTAATTGTVSYRIINNICTVFVAATISGTSNTNAMTMINLPTACMPAVGRDVLCASLRDNGGAITGVANVSPAGVVSFSLLAVSGAQILQNGAFTAAGGKGVLSGWNITYPL